MLRKAGGEVCKKKMPYSSNQSGRELKSKDQEEIQKIKEEISRSTQGEDVTRYKRKDFKEKRINEKS